jgi:polyisoprenoid-binding protein YceI
VKRIVAWLVMMLASAAPAPARAADWKMDAAASLLEFTATFERTAAPGVFRQFDARLRFDADRPAQSSLEVTVAVTSADMRSADVNKAIGGAQWFDFARFPQAQFQSTDIRRLDATRYLARGILSLKGMQQPIEVPFTWTRNGEAARMEGELVVKRGPFGIGTGEWAATNVIGPDVKIRFDVRLRQGG